MHKLLNPQEASLDGEVEPLFILWSREGSLRMHGTPRITSFQSYGNVKPPLNQVKQLKAQASNRELFCHFLSRRQQIPPQNQEVKAMEKPGKT